MEDNTTTKQELGGVEQANSNNIVVMGAPKQSEPKAEPKADNIDAVADGDKSKDGLEKKQEAVKPNEDLQKPNANADNKQKPAENKSEPKPSSEKLEIDFGNSNKEKPNAQKETDKPKQATVPSVTNENVVQFLKENGFDGINTLEDLSQKVTLPESVQKYKDFHDETGGRSIKDFYNLQKDWNTEPKESRIKEFLRMKYPDLNEEQIKTQFDVINVTENDEEELTPRELTRAKAEFDKMDSEAVNFLNAKSKEYKVPLENKVPEYKAPSQEQIDEAHKDYWKQRDSSLNEFKEVSFNIKDLGEIKLNIDEDDRLAISQITQTADSLVGRFKDENNVVKTDELVLDTAWSIPSIRQKMITSMLEQANALTLDKFSKENRNVNLDDLNSKEKQTPNNNGHLVKIKGEKQNQKQSFGQPVFRHR